MKNIYRNLLMVVSLILLTNSILLHFASEKIKTLEASKISLKYNLYKELDSIAWNYDVTPNKRYVLGITRYYRCDAVKTKIEQELNP